MMAAMNTLGIGLAGADTRHYETRENPYELTIRELEVIKAIVEGATNSEIAAVTFHAEQTIKFHLSNIYRKMGVRNRVEAAVKWVREQEMA